MINITPQADEHLSSVISDNNSPAVRLSVNSGGCSGFTYDWQLMDQSGFDDIVDDYIIDLDGGKLVIDNISRVYVAGLTVDYKTDLTGARLTVLNPNEKSSCGCGESVQG